ncbi:adenylyl-sulfate kinase [Cohnella rhizosphaerae]|uniref:Adenylyl-sulfate kinase n=1 Tax=Cohnella rhizosphaerae TaxID=1457232 RepID=A0A9X4KVE5_9BACL|nr:adenylyl-sulfate kinase [Cohnella rhizosphaerae]MDG0811896.1 adenylyl-sulfate kinase [Cohnella rhizosphaerae]
MEKAFTMLLTGLSGAGKTTTALGLQERLKQVNKRVEILDGDIVRDEIGHLFGYSREERLKVSKILRFTAKLLNKNGISVIIAAISPYQEMRDNYRQMMSDYVETFVKCPLEVCVERDVKGLYQKALRGDVKHVVGVDEVFEIPRSPDIVIDTSEMSLEDGVEKIWIALKEKSYV